MGKYFIFFKNSISESLIYRTSVFLVFFSQLISTSVFIFLWSAIYREGGQIGDYTLTGLIQYFVLVGFINFAIQGIDISWRVSEDIRLGNVTNYILKPISYYKTIFSVALGKTCFNFILLSLVIIPLVAGGYFSGFNLGIGKISAIALSLAIAFILFTTFSFSVGLYAFWAGDGRGFNYAMKLIMLFFSGSIIPLNLLPGYVASVNDFLPFKSIAWVPISLITGKIEPSLATYLPGIIWMPILFSAAYLIYNYALKEYEGLGA
jgi:ABC-2 type transport system permease protein